MGDGWGREAEKGAASAVGLKVVDALGPPPLLLRIHFAQQFLQVNLSFVCID